MDFRSLFSTIVDVIEHIRHIDLADLKSHCLGWLEHNTKLVLVVGVVSIPAVYYFYRIAGWIHRRKMLNRELEKLPGLPSHWLKGSLHHHPGPNAEGIKAVVRWAAQFNTVMKFYFGPFKSGVLLFHPEPIKAVLKTTEPKAGMVDGIGGYALLKDWLGEGLLISQGPRWFRNRKLLTPAFHFEVLKQYFDVYNEATDILLEKFASSNSGEGSVEITQPISLATFNVILRCAFSYSDDVQRMGESHPFVSAVQFLGDKMIARYFKPHQQIDSLYYLTSEGREYKRLVNYVHKVADDVISNRKQALVEETSGQKRKCRDFLDILLLARDDEGNGLSDLEIRNEVNTFLVAGHDTTASAISWCLYSIAGEPEHQSKCREEMEQIIADKDSPYIQWDDLNQMTHLTLCIKEALRMHSPVGFLARENLEPLTLDGVTIPPGALIDINLHAMHHNPHVWGEDHMEFKPERFEPDKMKIMDSHAFCPFSAGPRNCIGQHFAMNEIKVVVSRLLHRFILTVDSSHEVEYKAELTMKAAHGIKLYMKEIK